MILGRIIGWILLLAGLSALVRDGLLWIDTGRWLPLGLGEGWRQLSPGSYERFAGWNVPLAGPVLALWVCVVLTGLGAILLVAFRRRRRRKAGVSYRPSAGPR